MSKITSEILAKIAPSTPHGLRDRFLPFLNEALPRYQITTKNRVSAFLCTTAIESAYFRATKEGKARKETKAGHAQAKYWPSGFFGRGLIQTTHKENYEILGEYLCDKGLIDDADLFVNHPELLEEPKWAVESACVFWVTNHLNRFADSGNIFAVEGITNRGNAHKEAWGEDERERVWKILLKIIPDDFELDSAAVSEEQDGAKPVAGGSNLIGGPTGGTLDPVEQPSIQIADQIVNEAKQEPALIDSLGEKADALSEWQEKLAKLNPANYLPTMPSGLGTKLLTGLKTASGFLIMVGGMIWAHPEWLAVGVVLIIVAAILWDRSRGRNNPKGAVPPEMLGRVAAAQSADSPAMAVTVSQTNEGKE